MTRDPFRRRAWGREKALLKVEYADRKDVLADYITSLGEGGMFVRTNLPLQVGEEINFVLSFPGLLEPLRLTSVVRWRRLRALKPGEEIGAGVEFVFRDEKSKAQLKTLLDALSGGGDSEVEARREPFRVLLVEDNELIREMFSYAVGRFHASRKNECPLELYPVATGPEALDILKETAVDLAIIDHFLPTQILGCDLIKHIRDDERLKSIPILMISVGGEEIRTKALGLGADLFLDKPVVMKQLVGTIESLITAPHLREPQPVEKVSGLV